MSKRMRQYVGILAALASYYLIHEGAHWLYAVTLGVFKQINVMALGIQIDVFRDQMTDTQLGLFCLAGPLATLLAGWVFTCLAGKICLLKSCVAKACCWYISIVLLVLDPLYLSILHHFVGGGDMNGIRLILPEMAVTGVAFILLMFHLYLLFKVLLPKYKAAFQ